MIELVRLAVLGTVVIGATVLMALPRRGDGASADSRTTSESTVTQTPVTTGQPVVTGPIVAPPVGPPVPPPTGAKPPVTTPATTPVTAPAPRTHTVQSGDTLQKIAMKHYGGFSKWRRIADANPGVDPSRLRPGTKLRIP